MSGVSHECPPDRRGVASGDGRGDRVFIYWDNSNIYGCAAAVAGRREGASARNRLRININGLMELARAGRRIKSALAAGSVSSPGDEAFWRRMESAPKLDVLRKFDRRGGPNPGEQGIPDLRLQIRMLKDALDYSGDAGSRGAPGVAVLLTGDGGFLPVLKRMRRVGWRVEMLAWRDAGCSRKMREWAEKNGVFVALDDYYEAVTFLELSGRPGFPPGALRPSGGLDWSNRPTANQPQGGGG